MSLSATVVATEQTSAVHPMVPLPRSSSETILDQDHAHVPVKTEDINPHGSLPSSPLSTPVFPPAQSPSLDSTPTAFQPSNPDSPIIHHRNSIAGSTVPNIVARTRRTGSLALMEDGPYFSSTRQFYNFYSLDQTRSYNLRIMARVDRGFFMANKAWTCYRRNYFQVSAVFNILGWNHSQQSEVPCLLEIPAKTNYDPGLSSQYSAVKNEVIESMDGLHIHAGHEGKPNSLASVMPARLELVTGFSISISSTTGDGEKKIDLIQHTPKRDKGPQVEPGLRPIRGGGTLTLSIDSEDQSVVTFERVQFKTATANNGNRRAAQQFYILMVDLYAHTENGEVFCVASSRSDSLVVRGRSPGHYVDTPERPLSTNNSPGLVHTAERRSSTVSQHSTHPYYSPYGGGSSSRAHSISSGAGMKIDMSRIALGHTGGGPMSPMSPGGACEYSPTVGASQCFPYQTHPAWAGGSALSSPSSTYDGSAFSSPTTPYPPFHPLQHPHHNNSPQEHPFQNSYFPRRPSSLGSLTPQWMMNPTGPSPGHPLDPPQEQNESGYFEGTPAYHGYDQGHTGPVSLAHPPTEFPTGFVPLAQDLDGQSFSSLQYGAIHPMQEPDQAFVKAEMEDGYNPAVGNCFSPAPIPPLDGGMVGPVVHSTDAAQGYLQENAVHEQDLATMVPPRPFSVLPPVATYDTSAVQGPLYQSDHRRVSTWN